MPLEEDRLTPAPPESVHQRFLDALRARDVDQLTGLYEQEAVIAPAGADPVCGIAAIRMHLAAMLAGEPTLKSETILAVRCGDTAVLRARWSMTSRSVDGRTVTDQGESTEIVKLQADGTWKCIIDLPHS